MLDLIGDDNNVVSSVRVYPGCTLKLFNDHNNVGLLDFFTADVSFLEDYNDQVSSLSCTCQGMISNTNFRRPLVCTCSASFQVFHNL
jgi:hypothetical protein